MKFSIKKLQAGFTIVELLIAVTVFSLVLLVAMAGFVQIGRLYFKGVLTAQTQEVNRAVIEEISQAIQFNRQTIRTALVAGGPEIPVGSTDTGYFCIGPKRYTYALDRKLSYNPAASTKQKRHVLWVDEPVLGCAESSTVGMNMNMNSANPCADGTCVNGRELVAENMRITKLALVGSGTANVWKIDVSIAAGDDEGGGALVTEGNRRVCRGQSFIVQFCAISELSTTAYRRVN